LGAALFGSTPEAPSAIDRPGRLEMATSGTLFIGRADTLPAEEWNALLHTLSTGRVFRRGDSRSRAFEPDLVVLGISPSTAEHGDDLLGQLRGRPDTAFLAVPPLSERPEDLIPAAEAVLAGFAMDGVPTLADDAGAWLREHLQEQAGGFPVLTELLKLASDYGSKAVVTADDLATALRSLRPAAPRQPSAPPAPPLSGSRKISVLFVLASPLDQQRLRLGEEVKRVREAVRSGRLRERFGRMEICSAATDRDLQRALQEEDWTIVHFSGHGTKEGLLLEDERGRTRQLPVQALARMLAQHRSSVECVILNACSTRAQGRRIACEIPFVIASPQAILDPHAIRFAEAFYDALAAGKSAEFAYEAGVIALNARNVPKREWPQVVTCARTGRRRGSDLE
jgi:hypothetical protein